jgi:hypothetical protein
MTIIIAIPIPPPNPQQQQITTITDLESPPNKIVQLDELGFAWDACEMNFECNVPRKYPDNPTLGAWVAKQRWKKNNNNGSTTTTMLTRAIIHRLEDIGFEWKSS